MADTDLVEIIKLCISLDVTAYKTYLGISQAVADPALKRFWADMADEEREHASYWQSALKLAEQGNIPQFFDDPPKIRAELFSIQQKIDGLLRSHIDPLNISDTFLLACRMEFFMTHHAFETLLQFAGCSGQADPREFYEQHIHRFIDAMSTFGASMPALELLGESLQRLWMENKALSARNSIDELTGIRNRRGFFGVAAVLGSLARRNGFLVGVMMADIDHFKRINDTYGHAKGDEVLRRVAQILQKCIRPSDVLGRYGGEEFCILMSQIDPGAARSVAEKLRTSVAEERMDGIAVTISIGVSCGILPMHRDVTSSLTDYLERADACLYEAKNSGRNKVVAARLIVTDSPPSLPGADQLIMEDHDRSENR